MNQKTAAVIGAGACGLCAAKTMLEAGFDVTVYEIGSCIGGMWCIDNDNQLSSAYRTLHINTSRDVTRFHDLDFDENVQAFPDHHDMHTYLAKYADHFNVTPLIRFNCRVTNVEPLMKSIKTDADKPDNQSTGKRWRVSTEDNGFEDYDTVIVASGHLHLPRHVEQFQNDFGGEYLHSHYYKEPNQFVGKRICIVGVGNSACDIASDVCVNSQRCVLVARSGVMILPKLMFGIPFTRITSKLQRRWIPYSVRRNLIKFMTWLMHGDMQKLGFKKADKRVHTTSNATLVTDIAYNRVVVKQGIRELSGKTITFDDGTSEEFDVLIGATGYLTDLPFLSEDIVKLDNNQMELYQRIVPPDWPGLYLLGFFNTDTALNWIFNHQSNWVRAIELEEAKLPDAEEMRVAIKQRKDWVGKFYRNTPRHHLEEESVPYVSALKKSLSEMRKRAQIAVEN